MENFVIEHLSSIIILVLLLVLAILCFVAKGKYRKIAKRILLSLVVAAEQKFGGGTGEIKFSYVAEKLHDKMPIVIQILFTEKDVAKMIEEAVDKMKDILADTPKNPRSITGKEPS